MHSRGLSRLPAAAALLLIGLSASPARAQYTYGKYLEPPTGRGLVGIGDWPTDGDYLTALEGLTSSTSPARPCVKKIRVNVTEHLTDAHVITETNVYNALVAAAGTGNKRIPEIVISFYEYEVTPPATPYSLDNQVTAPTDPDYNSDMITQINRIAAGIADFGKPVFCCIGQEFNDDFGFEGLSSMNYHDDGSYPICFQITHDILAGTTGVHCAFIWTWDASEATDWFDVVSGTSNPKWYPGDAYVDWYGLDMYQQNEFTSNSTETGFTCSAASKQSHVESFLDAADSNGFPVFLETSSVDVLPYGIVASSTDDSNALGEWFYPFFDFVSAYPVIKVLDYVSNDWTGGNGGPDCWLNGRIDFNDQVMGTWIETLEDTTYPHYLGQSAQYLLNGYDDSGWSDLGDSLTGAYGTPILIGSGTVTPSNTVTLTLLNAKPSCSSVALIVGTSTIYMSWHGGVLVPATTVIVPSTTDAAGSIQLSWSWPSLSPGTNLYYQYWIQESTGPATYAASNALQAHTL